MTFVLKKLAILVLLALFFVPAIFIGLLAIIFSAFNISRHLNEVLYAFNISRHLNEVLYALDKFIAATLGFSGRYTVSAECAVATNPLFRILRRVLNLIDKGHCEGAARNEGLL